MVRTWRFERIGVILALLFSVAALGMEISQRLSRRPAAPGSASQHAGEAQIPPAPAGEGLLSPFDPPKGSKVLAPTGKANRMTGWARGKKQYDFEVEKLTIFPDQRTYVGEGIQGGTLLGADGKPTIHFTAERATMNTDSKDLQIEGQVRVESADPKRHVTFITQGMRWIAAAERLECPNPVEVTQEGMVFRGRRMTADVRLKKLTIEGGFALTADADKVKESLNAARKPAAKGGR